MLQRLIMVILPQSWRENITKSGVVYDIVENKIIAEGLAMPHTPRIYNGELYVLLSATGELIKINPSDGSYDVIVKIDGFVRGMCLHKDYLFIGLSKLREKSSTFGKLPFAKNAKSGWNSYRSSSYKKYFRKNNISLFSR